jgi:hypothetical protein
LLCLKRIETTDYCAVGTPDEKIGNLTKIIDSFALKSNNLTGKETFLDLIRSEIVKFINYM